MREPLWRNIMKKLGTLLVLFLAIIGLAACASGKKDTASTNQKLKVVATNSIIADITKNIAGDKIDLLVVARTRVDLVQQARYYEDQSCLLRYF